MEILNNIILVLGFIMITLFTEKNLDMHSLLVLFMEMLKPAHQIPVSITKDESHGMGFALAGESL